jgi:myo-inositol-1(or 4)-monophosphatase
LVRLKKSKVKNMLEVAIQSAKIGGKVLLENFGKVTKKEIEVKSKNNFVTYVDRLSEEKIVQRILSTFPDHTIVAEESGGQKQNSEYRWIIDPLDGTTNFIQGIPMFAVSIGLEKNGEMLLGVIYEPIRKELFYAEKGKGAYLNDKKFTIADKKNLSECLIATGFPFRIYDLFDDYLKTFSLFMRKTIGIRRAGSAAIDLAYTAIGRFDGFWELGLSPWDIAGGSIIIEEAGGVITDVLGGKNYLSTGNVVAGNKDIHEQMLKIVKPILQGKV